MEKPRTKKRFVPTGENGFASIVIAIVLVLILSLITVGFAQLMRREQRSALDKQLSSQAYYAAESGVNAATKAINEGFTNAKPNCGPGDNSFPEVLRSNTVTFSDGGNPTNASYPCLLINPSPPDLHYDPLSTTISRTAEFTAVDNNGQPIPVTRIVVSWQDSGDNKTFAPNCTQFKTSDRNINSNYWSYTGMVRMQLLPLRTGSAPLNRDNLGNNALTAFLCPATGGTTNTADYQANISQANNGLVLGGDCNTTHTPLYCSATISGIPAEQSTFFINLRSLYAPTSVTIRAYNGSTQLRLSGAQILIDSTGKAQDVLRRVQVRVAATNGYNIPDSAVRGGDICKPFDLDPGATTSTAPSGSGCTVESLRQ